MKTGLICLNVMVITFFTSLLVGNQLIYYILFRLDEVIAKVYKKVLEENDNVLALYTAHHTSWVVSEDIRNSRRVRSLLAAADASNTTGSGLVYNTTDVLLYVDSSATYQNNSIV